VSIRVISQKKPHGTKKKNGGWGQKKKKDFFLQEERCTKSSTPQNTPVHRE